MSSSAAGSSWSSSFSPDQIAVYFLFALVTAALPAYLYHGIYTMSVTVSPVLYIGVILVSAALLTVGYKQTDNSAHVKLLSARASAPLKLKSDPLLSPLSSDLSAVESQAWSFFIVNLLYCALFLLLAFYVFKAFDWPWDYALSSVLASATAWQVGAALSR